MQAAGSAIEKKFSFLASLLPKIITPVLTAPLIDKRSIVGQLVSPPSRKSASWQCASA